MIETRLAFNKDKQLTEADKQLLAGYSQLVGRIAEMIVTKQVDIGYYTYLSDQIDRAGEAEEMLRECLLCLKIIKEVKSE